MWIFFDLVNLILEFSEFWGLCQENLGILVSCSIWGGWGKNEDLEHLDDIIYILLNLLNIICYFISTLSLIPKILYSCVLARG